MIRRRHLSELYIDWWHETLLANQNKPPAGGFSAAGTSGAGAGANAAAGGSFSQGENAQHNNVLSGDTEMADNDTTAFGYPVHGNGSADY